MLSGKTSMNEDLEIRFSKKFKNAVYTFKESVSYNVFPSIHLYLIKFLEYWKFSGTRFFNISALLEILLII